MSKKCKILTGELVVWNPHLQRRKDSDNKSAYHLMCRNLLYKLYPTFSFMEEVTVPITNKEVSYLDFYIPIISLAIEVHGQQHYTYNSFFHKDQRDFLHQKNKDRRKREWCELNNIRLIELNFKESVDEWKKKILQSQ